MSRLLDSILRFLSVRDKIRFASGSTLSLAVHILLIAGYFGFPGVDKTEMIEIREISFVDLTEEFSEPIKSKKKATVPHPVDQIVVPVASLASNEIRTVQPLQPTENFEAEEVQSRDMPRNQAPISFEPEEITSVSSMKAGEALLISPARGTSDDAVVHNPLALGLKDKDKIIPTLSSGARKTSDPTKVKRSRIILTTNANTMFAATSLGQLSSDEEASGAGSGSPNIVFEADGATTNITGLIANRSIIQKSIPPFPPWAKRQGVGATIALKFTVMEDGTIKENILVERTSGSQEWDRTVINALKAWLFEPLERKDMRHDQTGVITFYFVIA